MHVWLLIMFLYTTGFNAGEYGTQARCEAAAQAIGDKLKWQPDFICVDVEK